MTAPNNTSSRWRCSSSSPAPPNTTDISRCSTEASGLVETAIAEIRRLAHGIYPPLLVSGGLAQPCRRSPRHAPSPCNWTCRASAATPLRPRPPSISAAAKPAECHQTWRRGHHRHDHRPCRRPDADPHDQRHRPRIRPRDHRHRADQYDRPSVGHRRRAQDRHRARKWYSHHRRRRHSGGAQLGHTTGVCTPPPTVLPTR